MHPSGAINSTRPASWTRKLRHHYYGAVSYLDHNVGEALPSPCVSAAFVSKTQEGWHFSCEHGCTRDDYGKAGPFSVEPLKMDLPFVNVLCVHSEVPALLFCTECFVSFNPWAIVQVGGRPRRRPSDCNHGGPRQLAPPLPPATTTGRAPESTG